ncbi:hypothetical protein ACFO3A_13620 [Comamonas nitrativorans]|uniref:Uncharacterized protein n=1 Tax=Comamonas nitrativorans TaxID=108437 RepID=A0ABV9H0D4_9BURK
MTAFASHAVSPRTYVPQDQLYVWAMVNPTAPTLVGEVSLSALVKDCATFVYTPQWWHFALRTCSRSPRGRAVVASGALRRCKSSP